MTGWRHTQKICGTRVTDVLLMLATEIELVRAALDCDLPRQEDFVVHFSVAEGQPETQHIRVSVQLGGEERQFFAECAVPDAAPPVDQPAA